MQTAQLTIFDMRNLIDNKDAQRLISEWKMHGKIIVAVDYDDTIRPWKFKTQEECDAVIAVLRLAIEVGVYIVIDTACNTDRYPEIRAYCAEKGLKVDSINVNPIELPYGNQGRAYANIFINDRAGLELALEILEFAAYTMRSYKHSSSEQTVEF